MKKYIKLNVCLAAATVLSGPASGYTLDQLEAYIQQNDPKLYNTIAGKTLQDASALFAKYSLPPINVNDVTAILANPQLLKFVISGQATTTTYSSNGTILSQAVTPLPNAYYTITDKNSLNQFLAGIKTQTTITGNGDTSVKTVTKYKPIAIDSVATGNIFTVNLQQRSGTCTSPNGTSYTTASWDAVFLNCLGLAASAQSVSAINTFNQITTNNSFIYNRPTTEFENDIRFMRSSRLNSLNSDNANVQTKSKGGSSGADQYQKISEDLGLFFSAGGASVVPIQIRGYPVIHSTVVP